MRHIKNKYRKEKKILRTGAPREDDEDPEDEIEEAVKKAPPKRVRVRRDRIKLEEDEEEYESSEQVSEQDQEAEEEAEEELEEEQEEIFEEEGEEEMEEEVSAHHTPEKGQEDVQVKQNEIRIQ